MKLPEKINARIRFLQTTVIPMAIEDDPAYQQATKIVQETGKASVSCLVGILRIGYDRAQRLLEVMTERGILKKILTQESFPLSEEKRKYKTSNQPMKVSSSNTLP